MSNTQEISELVQGQQIDSSNVTYYDKDGITGMFDLDKLNSVQLSHILHNLLVAVIGTTRSMSKVDPFDDEMDFWRDDYANELDSFSELEEQLNKFGKTLPCTLTEIEHVSDIQVMNNNAKTILGA